MKKLFIILAVLFCFGINAYGAGTVVEVPAWLNAETMTFTVTFTCTADAAAATYPATAFSAATTTALKGWHLYRVRINPGAVAPTANYDLTITEQGGDVLGGAGLNLSATATEFRAPAVASVGTSYGIGEVTMADTWTLTLENNAVNSAVTVITLFFTK